MFYEYVSTNLINILENAKNEYDKLKKTEVICPALNDAKIVFNRIGWRHICNGSRGSRRIRNSFGLMSLVPQIITSSDRWIFAKKSHLANQNHSFYTLRANVIMKDETLKVQVIIRHQLNRKGEKKYVFYSVHIVNK